MEAALLDDEVISTARETATAIQSDPRMAVIAYNKRLTIETLTREVTEINDRILAARQERAIWMNSLPEIAVQHANDNEWCEEFDRAMAAAGLPCNRRGETNETVTVYGSVTASLSVDVGDMLADYFSDYTIDEVDEGSVNVTFVFEDATYQVEDHAAGECACDEVDTDLSRNELAGVCPAADSFDDNHSGATFTFNVSSCTNCD